MPSVNHSFSGKAGRIGPARQRGITTLVIAILLLLILSVVTALSVNVGVFEQRSAANEHRAQMVQTATEAAMNQAVEYLRANAGQITNTKQNLSGGMNGWMFDPDEDGDTFRWQRCSQTYAPSGLDIDPCQAIPSTETQVIDAVGTTNIKKNQMYRFMSAGSARLPLSEKFQGDAQLFDDVGGFPIAYETYATMCILDVAPMDLGLLPVCSLNPERKGQVVINVMSRARLGNESADSEVKQTVVTIGAGLNAPNVPIIASGGVDGLGSAQIVPNPNAGGNGAYLSIWSASDVDISKVNGGGSGAMRTCHLGEFLKSDDPEFYDGTTICPDCACSKTDPDTGLISGKDPSTPGYEGTDILDVDGSATYDPDPSTSLGQLPDNTFFPEEPLDDDTNDYDDTLFEYTFGQDVADENTSGSYDSATAYRTNCPDSKDLDVDGNTTELINCADAYLATLFTQVADCDDLGPSSNGYLWVRIQDCKIGQQVGTPSRPVVLVSDSCLDVLGKTEFYGLLFIRYRDDCGANTNFFARGGGQIYGVVISEGAVKIRGSVQIIYNQDVIDSLAATAGGSNFAVIPGSWSDSDVPDPI